MGLPASNFSISTAEGPAYSSQMARTVRINHGTEERGPHSVPSNSALAHFKSDMFIKKRNLLQRRTETISVT